MIFVSTGSKGATRLRQCLDSTPWTTMRRETVVYDVLDVSVVFYV